MQSAIQFSSVISSAFSDVDSLAWLLVITTVLVGACVALYSLFYFPRDTRDPSDTTRTTRRFWLLFWLLQITLNSLWLSSSLFTAYIALELLTVIAINMVILDRQPKSLAAGRRYLYTALCSSIFLLVGLVALYYQYGSLRFATLGELLNNNMTTQLALLSITLGLVIKTAIVPMHRWLPQAHGVALAPISALHATLVTKASFYILARMWFEAGTDLMPISIAQGLGALGALSIAYGGYKALQQRNIKMLIAYSTVAQLGYLLLLFPLATGTSPAAATAAWQGSMLHLIAHAFAKSAMFLSIGTLVAILGSKNITALGGTSMRMPISLMAFGLASVSLMGLPPSGGFNAKWLLLQSALLSGQWHWVMVLLGGSLLTATYIFKVFSLSFDQRAIDAGRGQLAPVSWGLELTALLLAAIAILLGFIAAVPEALDLQLTAAELSSTALNPAPLSPEVPS